MTSAQFAVALFAACNSARVLAYIPQVIRVIRDRSGAHAVSCMTWGSFVFANLSTVAYALLVISDWRMAAVFGANAVCCLIIVAVTVYKRCRLAGWRLLHLEGQTAGRSIAGTYFSACRIKSDSPASGHSLRRVRLLRQHTSSIALKAVR
jgi:uncharacterized protein with PQ loop repeat